MFHANDLDYVTYASHFENRSGADLMSVSTGEAQKVTTQMSISEVVIMEYCHASLMD